MQGGGDRINNSICELVEWCCRTFARLAEDPAFHFSIKLQPGDIELLHNPTVLHSRSDVVDGEVTCSHLRWPVQHCSFETTDVAPDGSKVYCASRITSSHCITTTLLLSQASAMPAAADWPRPWTLCSCQSLSAIMFVCPMVGRSVQPPRLQTILHDIIWPDACQASSHMLAFRH